MKKQNYDNHKKWYPPHHFIFLPLMSVMIILGAVKAFTDVDHHLTWVLFSFLSFSILYLALMLRQHYALGNQDRIVRLEFRLRYYEIFGTSSAATESKLNFAQISALRFADNIQFKVLLEKAIEGNLTGNKIKKAITNWQADDMRV